MSVDERPGDAAQRRRRNLERARRKRDDERKLREAREQSRRTEAKDKRLAKHLDDPVVRATASGKFRPLPGSLPPETEKKLQAAGLMPSRGGGLAFKTAENLAEAAVNAPGGIYQAGKAVALDARDTAKGKPTLKRTGQVGKAVAVSTKDTVRHPLRRPGDTLLLGWGGIGAGAGAASRVAAAGSQLRKGAGLKKAVAGKPYEGGSLLRAPQPRDRVLKHGDLEVRGLESRNKAVAAVTRRMDKRRGGQVSAKRAGQELNEELRITEALERAPMMALGQRAKKLTTAQETAIRVVAEGKPVAARVAAHERDMRAAKTPQARRDLRQKILLLKAAERYVDDTGVKPRFREDFKAPLLGGGVIPRKGVGPKELAETYSRAGKVAAGRERTLVKVGALDEGQIEPRKHAPGRVIEGARMETQKQAQAARGVKPTKARVEQFRDYPGRSKTVTRERTREEAEQRLADVEAEYERVMRPLVDRIFPPAIRQSEQARRNRLGNTKLPGKDRSGRASGTISKKSPRRAPVNSRVIDDAYEQAEARLAELAAKPNAHPSIRRVAAIVDERAQLRATLADQAFMTPAPGAFGALTETIPGKPRRVHLREQRATKGVKATPRLAGAEDFAGGDFRVPYTARQAPRAHEGTPNFRGGVPRKPSSTTNAYTGGLLRSGNFRDDAARQVAESGVEAQRYAGALRLRDRLLQGAKDEPFDGGVPIKTDDLANKPYPPQVARILAKSDEGAKLSRSEQKYLGKQYDRIVRDLGLDPDAPIDPVPGVKWIDQQLLEELHRQGAPLRALIGNRGTDVIDGINNFSRLAIFYTKPGYVPPNVIGNALLNVNQQGVSALPNLLMQGKRNRRLSEDALQAKRAVMGEGVIASLGGGNKGAPLAPTANYAAGILGKVTDQRFRDSSFDYEARQAGFRSGKDVEDLLTNPARRQELIQVAKRANREVIDYGRMSKKEAEIVRRALFIYPFLKASTLYTGRFVKEHPVKAAATGQLSGVAREEADRKLGPRPSYAEGIVPVGKGKVVNLAGVGLNAAPAQFYRAGSDFVTGRDRSAYRLSEMLTPAASLGLAALTRRDSFTGRKLEGPGAVGKTLVDSFPQKLLYDRLTRDQEGTDNRVYPYSKTDALLAYGLGSVAPKPVNVQALNEQAAREDVQDLPPAEKAYRKIHAERREFFVAAKKHMPGALEDGKLPKKLRTAFNIEAERQALYNRSVKGKPPGTVEYHQAKYQADLTLLVKHKLVTAERAREVLAAAAGASLEELKDARRGISEKYYQAPGGQLHFIGHARKSLEAAGASLP